LAVGDTRAQREDMTAFAADLLPAAAPRYLMGVGTPPDLLVAIGCGVDMFDCVIPTRMAWQGTAFTSTVAYASAAGHTRRRTNPSTWLYVFHVPDLYPRLPSPPGQMQ
jgi:queuine tRNA-ribosyltransferase